MSGMDLSVIDFSKARRCTVVYFGAVYTTDTLPDGFFRHWWGIALWSFLSYGPVLYDTLADGLFCHLFLHSPAKPGFMSYSTLMDGLIRHWFKICV